MTLKIVFLFNYNLKTRIITVFFYQYRNTNIHSNILIQINFQICKKYSKKIHFCVFAIALWKIVKIPNHTI